MMATYATEYLNLPVPKPMSLDIRHELPVALPHVHTWSTPARRLSALIAREDWWNRRTPLAETVQDGAVLRQQRSFHDLELQGCILRRIVDAIDGELVGTKRAGVVPGVIAGDGSCIGTASIHLANSVEVRVAIASKAVVDPFLGWEAVVVLFIGSAMSHEIDSHLTNLEIVNSPLRKGLRVYRFVTQRARVATACHGASTRVHAILQAQSMDLVCGAAHAIRELFGIRHQSISDRITVILHRPTIVEDNVLVPGVLEAQVDHGVRGLHDLSLVHIAEVCVLVLMLVPYANLFISRTNP
jgi:hypothetical protein